MKASPAKSVRCAIYTRISTDQGLDQDFNSLDARYEAASAYIKSQSHAGWILIRSRYDAVRARRGALVRRRFLHIKGELVLREGAPQATMAAEQYFLQSLDWARRQGALSWELRTSTSLARLQHGQGRIAEARSLLQSVYDRFSEGFETADLKTAKALLKSLHQYTMMLNSDET
jgi:hypothetical protein